MINDKYFHTQTSEYGTEFELSNSYSYSSIREYPKKSN